MEELLWKIVLTTLTVGFLAFILYRNQKNSVKDSRRDSVEEKIHEAPLYTELRRALNMLESDNIKIFDEEIENTNSVYCKKLLHQYIAKIKSYSFLERNPFDKLQVDIKSTNGQILQSWEFDYYPTACTRYFYDKSGFLRLSSYYHNEKMERITLYEILPNKNRRKLTFDYYSDIKKFGLSCVEEESCEKQKLFSYEYYDGGGILNIRKYNNDNSFMELYEGLDPRIVCHPPELTKYDSLGRKIYIKSYNDTYPQKLSNDQLKSETNYFYDERGNEIERRTHSYETGKTDRYLKEFDEHNNLIHEISARGSETFYKYDSNNNLIYKKDVNARKPQNAIREEYLSYDEKNRLVLRKEKDSITRYHYKKDGSVIIKYEDKYGITKKYKKISRSFHEEINQTFKTKDNKGEIAIKLSLNEFG
jgi:YD repeat-containing protein